MPIDKWKKEDVKDLNMKSFSDIVLHVRTETSEIVYINTDHMICIL